MCGDAPEVDTSVQDQLLKDAEAARKKEEEREKRIRTGTGQIDDTFGQFNNKFYQGYESDYLAAAQPQLDQQFRQAGDELSFALARAGTSRSSVAGDKLAELTGAYTVETAGLTSQAKDATAQLRAQVAGEKSDLVSMLNATGDADRAANEALARSGVLKTSTPSFNPLGDVFAGFASGVGNYQAGRQSAALSDAYFGTRPATAGSARSSGSGRIVG